MRQEEADLTVSPDSFDSVCGWADDELEQAAKETEVAAVSSM